jgi:hypothetical protein
MRADTPNMRALSILALAGAASGAFFALLTFQLLCHGDSGGSLMCPDGEPTITMTLQLIVGVAGLVPPILMTYLAFRNARRAAIIALICGLVLWAGWGFLNDAAVHGWSSQMTLIP